MCGRDETVYYVLTRSVAGPDLEKFSDYASAKERYDELVANGWCPLLLADVNTFPQY